MKIVGCSVKTGSLEWCGCSAARQLNTVFKTAFRKGAVTVEDFEDNVKLSRMFDEIEAGKVAVRIVKHGGINTRLSHSLMQDSETIFHSLFDVLKRFIEFADRLFAMLLCDTLAPQSLQNSLALITRIQVGNIWKYPTLEAARDVMHLLKEIVRRQSSR